MLKQIPGIDRRGTLAPGLTPEMLREASELADAIALTQLLSVPRSHPLTPGVLWLDAGRVSVSLPWAASGGAWDDSGKWYDSQSWSE